MCTSLWLDWTEAQHTHPGYQKIKLLKGTRWKAASNETINDSYPSVYHLTAWELENSLIVWGFCGYNGLY